MLVITEGRRDQYTISGDRPPPPPHPLNPTLKRISNVGQNIGLGESSGLCAWRCGALDRSGRQLRWCKKQPAFTCNLETPPSQGTSCKPDVDSPKGVTLATWGLLPTCKQALIILGAINLGADANLDFLKVPRFR